MDVGGLPIQFDELKALVNKPEVKEKFNPQSENQEKLGRVMILSDAAHSFGAKYNGLNVGSEVDFTVFSFHAVKNLTTAEGGAICINLPAPFDNSVIYNQLNTLSLHGQNKDALAKTQRGSWEYDVIDAGFKCNMTDILSSIGLVELERYDKETLTRRKNIFKEYTKLLGKYDWAIAPHFIDNKRESSYHLFLLRIKDITLEERNSIIQEIFSKNVSVNVHYKPLPMLSYYKNLGYEISHFPVANSLWECEISLPVYYDLTNEDIDIIVDAVVSSVIKVRRR